MPINDAPPRRLDIAVDGDDLVSASLTVISKGSSDTRIGSSDHQKIVDILDDARGLMTRAQSLIEQESKEAKDVVDAATLKFREAREYIMKQSKTEDVDGDAAEPKKEEEERELVATVDGDGDDLDLDLSREVYETVRDSDTAVFVCIKNLPHAIHHCTPHVISSISRFQNVLKRNLKTALPLSTMIWQI